MKHILHVIGQLGRGGDTTVVLDVVRRANPSEYQFDFLTHDRADMEVVERLENEGYKVYKLDGDLRKMGYMAYLKTVYEILKNADHPYDIIHTHTSFQSGVVLKAAKKAGIPVRICHAHTNTIQQGANKLQKLFVVPFLRKMCLDNLTKAVSCSNQAGKFLFGKFPYEVIYNGVDTDRFRDVSEREVLAVRASLKTNDNDILIGHVANFATVKNHPFIIELAKKLSDRPDVRFVLVGKGTNFEKIIDMARPLGNKVIFTGQRSDVNVLMKAFDMIILPSFGEGFPVTIIEAQASGLPCIISENITLETETGLGLVTSIPLTDIDSWVKAIRQLDRQNDYKKRRNAADYIKAAGFGKQAFYDKWIRLYL